MSGGGYIDNGTEVTSNGSALPTATGANQPLLSTAPGTTYAALDSSALPIAATADWRLYAAANGDTTIVNSVTPGTFNLTANAAAAAMLGMMGPRGNCFAVLDTGQLAVAARRAIAGASSLLPAALSVVCWFTLTQTPVSNERFLWMKRDDDADWNAGVTGLLITPARLIMYQTGVTQVTTTTEVPVGIPQLAVMTWSNPTLKVYLGETLIATGTPTWTSPAGSWGLAGQAAAGTGATWAQGLPGVEERVAVFPSALSAANVATLARMVRWPLPLT